MSQYIFKMPDIGEGVVEAEITAWHVSVGDVVEEDDAVADAMTDKATVELTAPVSGTVTKLGCEAGDILAVGASLIVFETDDSETDNPDTDNPQDSNTPDAGSDTNTTQNPSAPSKGEYIFKMPDIGEGVVEAEITVWHVEDGQLVEEDEPVADAMTDKATIELTAPVTGKIIRRGCEAGDIIAVGAPLIVFETEGEDKDASTSAPTSPAQTHSKPAGDSAGSPKILKPVSTSSSSSSSSGKALASPAVRKRARDAGLDLTQVNASGTSGQVTHADLDMFEKALEPDAGETRIKIIGLRRKIAEQMQASKRHIPHFTYVDEIDVTALEALRNRTNEKRGERPKLTVLPFIIRAMIMAIREFPQVNARYMDEQGFLSQFEPVHLGIATQTDTGLVVPVIRNAQSKNIWDTAAEITRLAEGARDNKLSKDDLTGATTTLTSLGPLGGIVTTPVINRPEVAIFGPNKIRPKLELREGEIVERRVMNFSISCDHRIIDGYDAALMVQVIKGFLQDPLSMFLE